MKIKSLVRKCAAGGAVVGLTVGVVAMGATSASADDIGAEIQAGSLTFSIAGGAVSFLPASYSLSEQVLDTTVAMDIADMTATADGWVASLQSTDLTSGGNTIGAANVAFDPTTTTLAGVVGDDEGSLTGVTEGTVGNLLTPRTIYSASDTNGEGMYAGDLGLKLTVPGSQAPGTYSGTLTLAIVPQP